MDFAAEFAATEWGQQRPQPVEPRPETLLVTYEARGYADLAAEFTTAEQAAEWMEQVERDGRWYLLDATGPADLRARLDWIRRSR
jgi:hypothetical protein